ncbi:alpha/beta fold hydrolase [Polyangium jinanense]|uniref:Alpha/beta hydrolase n=1 Tax=Polyangium jinanense TaxID=2829994 RepID=A0A9X4AWY2_9BACT|nr:alpha/beta hydrolase [Polyangium jinanense]MDC3962880.1 alpha/beta hydrolase [Polyangium jinanense]MDC3987848.1 alpha/beta hydrolase [Polyangium jinanense]
MPFLQSGSLTIHWSTRGDERGEPVVFVHGNWTTSLSWRPVLDRLSARFRAVVPDLRGRGQTHADDHDYRIPRLAQDLAVLMDALGLSSAHLVGHSLGTAVVLELALSARARARSLTLVAPAWPDGMPRAYHLPERQRLAQENITIFGAAFRGIAPTAPDDAFFQELLAESHRQRPEATIATLDALCEWAPGDRLRELAGVPALVVSGESDMLSTRKVGARTAELLGARHEILLGVGHSPNLEAPDTLVALLDSFVKALPGG